MEVKDGQVKGLEENIFISKDYTIKLHFLLFNTSHLFIEHSPFLLSFSFFFFFSFLCKCFFNNDCPLRCLSLKASIMFCIFFQHFYLSFLRLICFAQIIFIMITCLLLFFFFIWQKFHTIH